MTLTRRFMQVDVFTDVALKGNALAVVLDGEGLDDAQMAAFARWTNLSETTFLLPPTDPAADYRVRIFTTTTELPFAGHPTLGSCHAWLAAGGKARSRDEIVQQCGVGLVRIRRSAAASGDRLAFAAPPRRRSGPIDEAELTRIARVLQIPRDAIVDHQHCHNGPEWRAVMLRSADEVLALRPALSLDPTLEIGVVAPLKIGVVGARSSPSAADEPMFEVRAFFPAPGGALAEDPVTGSLNAALAQWLIGSGQAPARYVASQGTALGRAGRVHVEAEGGEVWIGGATVACIEGALRL